MDEDIQCRKNEKEVGTRCGKRDNWIDHFRLRFFYSTVYAKIAFVNYKERIGTFVQVEEV
jgi:hypothetical protein